MSGHCQASGDFDVTLRRILLVFVGLGDGRPDKAASHDADRHSHDQLLAYIAGCVAGGVACWLVQTLGFLVERAVRRCAGL